MADEGVSADAIKGLGWRQGSILPEQLVSELRDSGLSMPPAEPEELWLVLSHSCDVVNRDFDLEPHVEIVRMVRLTSEADGMMAWFRNPRSCHFRASVDGAENDWKITVHDRVVIPRQRLATCSPDGTRELAVEHVRRLASWVGRRYTRAAFPDTFNERWQATRSQIHRKLKAKGHLFTAVFLMVENDELSPGVDYKVVLIGCMNTDDFADTERRREAQQLLNDLEAALAACQGICVSESLLRSESEISLDDLRLLKRWDMEYLSLRDLNVAELPPTA